MREKLNFDKGKEADFFSLSIETLAEKVYSRLTSQWQDRVSIESVKKVVARLNLTDRRTSNPAPRLIIRRLKFIGEKHLHGDQKSVEINYEQLFESGVNVILIPDNLVGKSSIMKIIEFALTGDNNIDKDVADWISDVWLHFFLDERKYTIILSTRQETLQGALIPGDSFIAIEEVEKKANYQFNVSGLEEIKSELQHFFFTNLELTELSWMANDPSSSTGSARRSTSWRTYFQALSIEDLGDKYLICDPEHNFGQQEIKILSSFLGLHLAPSLNELSVESSRLKKELDVENQQHNDEVSLAEEEKLQLEHEREEVMKKLATLEREQRERRRAYLNSEPTQELRRLQDEVIQKSTEKTVLELDREQINQQIQQERTQARLLREAIRLKLHFTGLSVTLCPNCDTPIDEEAISKEEDIHLCRLCAKPASGASPEQIKSEEANAEDMEDHVSILERERTRVSSQITELNSAVLSTSEKIESLKAEIDAGIERVWMNPEEEAERESLNREIGSIDARIQSVSNRGDTKSIKTDAIHAQIKIVDALKKILLDEAESRNKDIKQRLASLMQELIKLTGADSISDIEITPMGTMQLKKNDTSVRFTQIMNQGERLRLKLALFLAMLQLGREPSLGRHPGLLLIDQPGSAEMVTEDSENLASIFYNLDKQYSDRIQIFCFTAADEFRFATSHTKIYGPMAGKYAF